MDRNSIIGYILIFVIFAGYLFYTNKNLEEAREIQRIEDSIAMANSNLDSIQVEEQTIRRSSEDVDSENVADTANALANAESTPDSGQVVIKREILPETLETIGNEKIGLTVTSKGGRIADVHLKGYKTYDSSELQLFTKERSSFNYTIPLKSGIIRTQELDFGVASKDSSSLVMEHKLDGGGTLRHVYSLNDGFLVDYRFELEGLSELIAKKNNEYMLDWIMETPRQEKSLKDERQNSTVYYKYKNDSDVDNLSLSGGDEDQLMNGIQWVNFKQKFFSATLIIPDGLEESGTDISVSEPEHNEYVAQMAASMPVAYHFNEVDAQEFQFYFGPNHYQTLKAMDIGMESIVPIGSSIIRAVNKYAIIPIFNWLDNYFVNYGLIILILTLMIKGVLIFPMYKIYISSAKMKLLKPELDAIKEKVGGDMQKMQQEQMKLYKKAGVSPFGGCLPQLIQFPILIAMFRFFPASIELRQKSFLWAEDLSTFDSILQLPFSIPFYGDHVSLFTLLMAGSTFLYTMFNSQSSAAMTGPMKSIMYLMPLMLLFWFNSYSSGLSYYYFLANMITFGQNWIFRTFIVDDEKLHKQIEQNKKKKVNVKPSRFQKRVEAMAKKRGIDPKQLRR